MAEDTLAHLTQDMSLEEVFLYYVSKDTDQREEEIETPQEEATA